MKRKSMRNAGYTLLEVMISLIVLSVAVIILTPDYEEKFRELRMAKTINETQMIIEAMRTAGGANLPYGQFAQGNLCRQSASNTVWTWLSPLGIDATNPYGAAMSMTDCNTEAATLTQTVDAADGDYIAGRIPNSAHNGTGTITTFIRRSLDATAVSQNSIRRDWLGAINTDIDMQGNDLGVTVPGSTGTIYGQHLVSQDIDYRSSFIRPGTLSADAAYANITFDTMVVATGRNVTFTQPTTTIQGGADVILENGFSSSDYYADGELRFVAGNGQIDIEPPPYTRHVTYSFLPQEIHNPVVVEPTSGDTYDLVETAGEFWVLARFPQNINGFGSATLTAGTFINNIAECRRGEGVFPTAIVSIVGATEGGDASLPPSREGPRVVKVYTRSAGTDSRGFPLLAYGIAVEPPTVTTHCPFNTHAPAPAGSGFDLQTCYKDFISVDFICPVY